jgi:exopolyphosphatase/guanosine-5'-triphosphate,3'-diphosphate pyrophosphatase
MQKGLPDYDRGLIEGTILTRDAVWAQLDRLWGMTLADRRKIPGLPPERADVILFGAAVFAEVMDAFHIESLRITLRGLRFAAVMDEKTFPAEH